MSEQTVVKVFGRERSDYAMKPARGTGWTLSEQPTNAASRHIRDAVQWLEARLQNLPNVKVNRSASDSIIKDVGPWNAASRPLAYDPDTRTIEINERCTFWNQPKKYMRRLYQYNQFSSPDLHHLEIHEIAHAKHHEFAERTYNVLRSSGGIWRAGQQRELAEVLSEQAAESPLEFVAEFYAARVSNAEMSPGKLAEFEQLYQAFEGPTWE